MTLTIEDLPPLFLPEEALDDDTAIVGRKGRGKTNTAKVVAEYLLATAGQLVIIDPMDGIWAGLQSSADGEEEGFPVAVFGGDERGEAIPDYADLPLPIGRTDEFASMLEATDLSAVLSVGALPDDPSAPEGNVQDRFVADVLGALYRHISDKAIYVLIDEAHIFAPEQGSSASKRIISKIAKTGRSRGFRLITVTQRTAEFSKSILTQAGTLIAHGVNAPQDRKAVKAWIDGNGDAELSREVERTLSQLGRGEAWVWPEGHSPARASIPLAATLDTSYTPKRGQRKRTATASARPDLSALAEALRPEPPKADGKGTETDLSEERLRKAEALGFLRGKTSADAAARAQYFRGQHDAIAYIRRLLDDYEPIGRAPENNHTQIDAVDDDGVTGNNPTAVVLDAVVPAPEHQPSKTLPPAAQALLDAFVSLYPRPATFDQAATFAGRSRKSSTHTKAVSELKKSGLLAERQGGRWTLAEDVAHDLGADTRMATGKAAIALWMARLKNAELALFSEFVTASGRRFSKRDIATAASVSPTSSTTAKALSELHRLGLIERRSGIYRLHPDLLTQESS